MGHGFSQDVDTCQSVPVEGEKTLSYRELLFREIIAIESLAVILFSMGLIWAAPLEQLANPLHTPNPAKAPWYFTGLQELLHYFPPFVAGIILPSLIVSGLVFIPFFPTVNHLSTQDAIQWMRRSRGRLLSAGIVALALLAVLIHVHAWDALLPLCLIGIFLSLAAPGAKPPGSKVRSWLGDKPLSFWIMTLFLLEAVVLTSVGTFFRGPGWTWVWPWSG